MRHSPGVRMILGRSLPYLVTFVVTLAVGLWICQPWALRRRPSQPNRRCPRIRRVGSEHRRDRLVRDRAAAQRSLHAEQPLVYRDRRAGHVRHRQGTGAHHGEPGSSYHLVGHPFVSCGRNRRGGRGALHRRHPRRLRGRRCRLRSATRPPYATRGPYCVGDDMGDPCRVAGVPVADQDAGSHRRTARLLRGRPLSRPRVRHLDQRLLRGLQRTPDRGSGCGRLRGGPVFSSGPARRPARGVPGPSLLVAIWVDKSNLPRPLGYESFEATRGLADADIYGGRITGMLLPSSTHRLELFRSVRAVYDGSFPNPAEGPALGLVSTLAFLGLTGWAVLGFWKPRWLVDQRLMATLAGLTFVSLFIFVAGGLGTIWAFTLNGGGLRVWSQPHARLHWPTCAAGPRVVLEPVRSAASTSHGRGSHLGHPVRPNELLLPS